MPWLTEKISRKQLNQKISRFASELKTLEVGSFGQASYTKYFPNRIGVDVKPGKGTDIVASVYELPFGDAEFDVVLRCSVLEHLEDPRKAIAEMMRVLKPKGRIIVSVPFLFPLHDAPGDYWRFTKYGLRSLFSQWEIVKLEAETDTKQALAVLMQRLGYQTRMRINPVSKALLFICAKILNFLPSPFLKIYGDISKNTNEPEAFASSLFLVAEKPA
jgi:SAM-dependent methyltransferase